MPEIVLTCNAVEPFDAFALRDWLATAVAAGRVPGKGDATLVVNHPEREGEGSCRWCGCRENERLRVVDGKLA